MDGKVDREKRGKLAQNEKTDKHLKNRGIDRETDRQTDKKTDKKTDKGQNV
jgi:hypothetical protein